MRKLRFAGRLVRLAGGGWQLDAELGATVIQTCVVTLDPVTTRIDQPVRRTFLPEAAPRGAEIVVSPDEDDEIEPLGDRIDLGLVAIEALALALPRLSAQAGRDARRPAPAPPSADEGEPGPSRRWRRCAGKSGSGS